MSIITKYHRVFRGVRWQHLAVALAISTALGVKLASAGARAQNTTKESIIRLLMVPIILMNTAFLTFVVAKLQKLWTFVFPPGNFDKESKRNGGELVAEALRSQGVQYVFTLVGGHISPILVESEKRNIRVIDCRHEVTAVFAADAVARLTGVPGVAAVTAGPGLTNTVTAIKNAQMAESPVILIGGAAATIQKGRGALQDIDQMSLFKPICKWTATVTSVREIPEVVRKAFMKAQEGTPGPVFLEFPIDTLYPIATVAKAYGASQDANKPKPKGFFRNLVQMYLNQHLKYIFAGAWDKHDFTPLKFNIPRATPDQISQAAQIISSSKRPVILIGSQATLPPIKPDELKKALEKLGIPCFLGGMSRGLLGREGPLQIRQKRGEALREADVIIMVGMVADFRLDYGRALGSKAKIIAVNRDSCQLYKNSDIFWKPTLAIQGDAGSFVYDLANNLREFKVDEEWVKTLRTRAEERERAINETAEQKTDHINPLRLLQEVEKILPDDCILVADGGDFVGSASYIVRPRGPLRWLDPGAFGTLGVGGGFALGAKLVNPDLPVVILYGDGSLGYSVAEYDTFTRHKIPVFSIVGNDACWTQIAREQVPMFGSDVACKLEYTDYQLVADGYGGKGFMLDKLEDTQTVFRNAMDAYKSGSSVLINAKIGKTNFRDGSISV